ncbi:MAG: GxxExxY protein [Verrucomicrobiales bacterium]
MKENDIGAQTLQAAPNVHQELGSGLLDSAYEGSLARELSELGLKVERQRIAHADAGTSEEL